MAIEKAVGEEELRIIHEGIYKVRVNHRSKPRDDCRMIMDACAKERTVHFLLAFEGGS